MLSRLSRTPDQHLRQYRATITLRMSRANAPRVVVGHLRSGGIGHSPCLQTVPTNRASASVRVLNGPARGVRTRSALSSCSRSCTTYQPAPPSGVHFAAEPGCGSSMMRLYDFGADFGDFMASPSVTRRWRADRVPHHDPEVGQVSFEKNLAVGACEDDRGVRQVSARHAGPSISLTTRD